MRLRILIPEILPLNQSMRFAAPLPITRWTASSFTRTIPLWRLILITFAQERRIPVAVHSYPNADDDLSAVRRVVKIVERYPDLKLIVSHMGAFQWEQLLPLACYVDVSAILPAYVRTYGIAGTNDLLRKFGPNRLLFATDYPDNRHLQPTEIYAAYFHILNQMDFTEEEAKKIAYWNAKELLG